MTGCRGGRIPWVVCCLALAVLATGCVERKFVITSDQPGAVVYRDGKLIGTTPLDYHFDYYGTYQFTLVKDGYARTHVMEEVDAPWYAYPPIDFVVENLYPGTVQDIRRLDYQLQPLQQARVDQLIANGEALRAKGNILPPPDPPRFPEYAPQP